MTGRPRLLIVDDERGVRESLRVILEGDCECLTAESGDEALDIVGRETVDVVTLDLRMPGLGGIAVLERIKHVDPDIEVLIITGYGSLDTAVQGLRHRAFDYLAKPFETEEVRELVQKALARRFAVRRMKAAPEHMLSTLSHEFRTPLNVIMGYSSMLREETDEALSEEQRLALDRIQSNSNALLSYVETLFYMAELDRGLVPLVSGAVNVPGVLACVRDELASRAAAKGLGLLVEAPAGLVVATDEDKLTRLVRALADNAVRYTPAGEVVLAARPLEGGVALEVRDTGPGLAPELIAETRDVIANHSAATPPRLLGFGLRLAGRVVRTLGAELSVTAGAAGTAFHLAVPSVLNGHPPRLAESV
jgi:signal transduction histidine kinase